MLASEVWGLVSGFGFVVVAVCRDRRIRFRKYVNGLDFFNADLVGFC